MRFLDNWWERWHLVAVVLLLGVAEFVRRADAYWE